MVKMNFKTDKVNLNYSEEDNRIPIDPDKVKQFIAMIGGFLGALYLALNASGISVEWLNPQRLNAWMSVLNTGIPIIFVLYGIWKTHSFYKSITRTRKVLKTIW